MKKSILLCLMAITLFAVTGCGTDEITPKATNVEETDYTKNYEDVLASTYEFIFNIDNKAGPDEGQAGIWDAALALGDEALSGICYLFKDITNDNIPELIIGVFEKEDFAFSQNEIYAVYTIENDEPRLLLEGTSRSAYSLKEDGSLFYQGSNGAAYSIFGEFHILDGKLVCDNYYFTYPREDDPAVIEIYHNTEGNYHKEESKRLDMTVDEFFKLEEEFAKGTVKLKGTRFLDVDAAIAEKAKTVEAAPGRELLAGEWELAGGEVEGYEYSAEEAGYISELSIEGNTAGYTHEMNGEKKILEANMEFLDEPVYYGCGNDEWSARLIANKSDFGEEEEFYVTLTDENTLLLRHMYPFDGSVGVSHQTYTRK